MTLPCQGGRPRHAPRNVPRRLHLADRICLLPFCWPQITKHPLKHPTPRQRKLTTLRAWTSSVWNHAMAAHQKKILILAISILFQLSAINYDVISTKLLLQFMEKMSMLLTETIKSIRQVVSFKRPREIPSR
jgi:hypothetical protein